MFNLVPICFLDQNKFSRSCWPPAFHWVLGSWIATRQYEWNPEWYHSFRPLLTIAHHSSSKSLNPKTQQQASPLPGPYSWFSIFLFSNLFLTSYRLFIGHTLVTPLNQLLGNKPGRSWVKRHISPSLPGRCAPPLHKRDDPLYRSNRSKWTHHTDCYCSSSYR